MAPKTGKCGLIIILWCLSVSACSNSDTKFVTPLPYYIPQTSNSPSTIVLSRNSQPADSALGNTTAPQLAQVLINSNNIFDNPKRPGSRLINSTHWVTRENVIKRQIWLKPGDTVTQADLSELERNLRKLGLFSEVSVFTQPTNLEPHTVDLIVNTRDKLSLLGVAGGTFLGGVGEVGFLLSETNFLGYGHELQYRYVENSKNDTSAKLSYKNILLAGDDIYAGLELGKANNGDSIKIEVENRFQNFDDSQSWKIELKRETTSQDYFDEGELVVQVPREETGLNLERTTHGGDRNSSWRYGFHTTMDRTTYQDAQGSQANTIDKPDNQNQIFTGFLLARNRTTDRQSILGLDTLSYVQDVSLGYNLELLAGISHRKTDAQENTLPVFFFNASKNQSVSTFNYINAAFDSIFGIDGHQLDSWSLDLGLTWFNTRFKNQTTGARLKYRSADNRTGLPPQQLLGEDNGLRGYPAKEFSGKQSLLMNLEHRFKTNINFATLELGGVAFFDAGWTGDTDENNWLDNPKSSLGIGVRFGSPQLLGSSVLRLDFAYPLAESDNEPRPPTVSLAVGQVFGFNP